MATVNVKELETADFDFLENIKTAFYRLWKQKFAVGVATMLAACICLIYVGIVGVQTTYYTTATIYSVVYGSSSESYSGVSVMNQYVGLLSTSRVCDRAAANLTGYGISSAQLQSMAKSGGIYLSGASSRSQSYSYQLVLYVKGSSPANLTAIANEMANAFSNEINDISGASSLQVMDAASSVYASKSLSVKIYMLLFAAVGFLGSCGVIFAKELFSKKVYSIGQCESDKNQILGVIPINK